MSTFLLLETGGFLLLESGGKIVLEDGIGIGTIIINVSANIRPYTVFSFRTNLDPALFNIAAGDSRAFNVEAGVYSIVELNKPGWQTTYTVSNGDSNTAIDLNGEGIITVDVDNVYDCESLPTMCPVDMPSPVCP